MQEQITNLCECGCGKPAPLATKTRLARGYRKGEPMRFISGHQSVAQRGPVMKWEGPWPTCACGCGEPVPAQTVQNRKLGLMIGQPRRFVRGHNGHLQRVVRPPRQPRATQTPEHIAKRTAGQVKTGHARRGKLSPTYNTWRGMKDRTGNPNHTRYQYYGAIGITVCSRWLSFENFLADMGERPEGRTLDRIDPNGNYEPGNCRWATQAVQVANRRANPRDRKIDATQAFAIRIAAFTTSLSYSELGEMFGLAGGSVGCIVRNKIWKRAWLAPAS